jgi:hypothetical protein
MVLLRKIRMEMEFLMDGISGVIEVMFLFQKKKYMKEQDWKVI